MSKFIQGVFLASLLSLTTYADMWPTVANSGTSVTMQNKTNMAWSLGGVRYLNNGWEFTKKPDGVDAAAFAYSYASKSPYKEVNMFYKSNAKSNGYALVPPQSSKSWIIQGQFPWGTAQAEIDKAIPVAGSEYMLLRTGSQGLTDNPESELPLTLEQLDSVSNTPNFYVESYRPASYDSLGAKGGRYSGGLLDTWLGETQMQIAMPDSGLYVSGTPLTIDKTPTLYWMAGALVQEYLDVDMQILITQGAKETFSGVMGPGLTPAIIEGNLNGTEYTSYHVEAPSGLDRALSYPKLFPKYELLLSSAPDVTNSGITDTEFMGYYTRAQSGSTKLNSATSINGAIFTSLFRLNAYDLLSTATDICWKEGLEESRFNGDPYTGLGHILHSYVNGMWGDIGKIAGYFNTNFDPAAVDRNSLGPGNNNYVPENFNLAQVFIDASRQSLTDDGIEILDMPITRAEMLSVYFGDNGTVATQGDGGLLRHFLASNTAMRQLIWDKVNAGFDILKGRAPSVGTEEISLRYDFLALLRVVKGDIDFGRQYRVAGDAATLVPQYSTVGGCGGIELDDVYPYLTNSASYSTTTDEFIVSVNGTDDNTVKEVKYSLDYTWSTWLDAGLTNTNSANDKDFEIRVSKATIEAFLAVGDGESGKNMWIMVSDSAGNSTIAKIPVTYKIPEKIDSVAAYDNDGDGIADNLKAYISPSDTNDIASFEKMTYKWTNSNSLQTLYSGDSKISKTGNTILTITDNNFTEGAGVGTFNLEVDTAFAAYPNGYTEKTIDIGPKDILDRVGPAIEKNNPIPVYILPVSSADLDTLTLAFTEPVKDLPTNGTYLEFKTGNGTATSHLASNIDKNSTTNYTFVFPNNTLGSYDSVRIVSSSDLQDEVGNGAANNNQWAPISPKGSDDPEWVYGYIKDADADGYGDNITFTIKIGNSDEAFTVADIDSLVYKWNNASGPETELNSSQYSTSGDNGVLFSFDEDVNGLYGSGEGSVFMLFKKSANEFPLSGTIIDSVGPAIESAEYIVGKDNGLCTLTVILTEYIEDGLDAGIQYLVLGDGTKISQSAINKKSETEYEFIVNPGTIEDGDKVKLIHNSGLTDASAQKNPPLENNIEQDIVYIAATNKITSVEYFDTNGDGVMDKVVINFISSVDQTEDVDKMSFVINWLDEDGNAIAMNVSGTDFVKIDAKKIEWTVNTTTYDLKEDLTSLKGGYGHVTITQPNENTGSNETTNYGDTIAVDKMAPVLTSATYYKFKGAKPDELKITYSEIVSYTSMLPDGEPFDFFGNSGEYSMELEPVVDGGGFGSIEPDSQMTFVKLTGDVPVFGDSLNIDHTEKLIGADGNVQNVPNNKFVYLGVFSAITINKVSYHDISTPRDGYIDLIKVRTDTTISEALFDSLVLKIILNANRNFDALDVSDFSLITDDGDTGFTITVTQAPGTAVVTSVDANDKLMITGEIKTPSGFMMYDTISIEDSVAPVIIGAYLYPVEVTEKNFQDLIPDTLKIEYSETVNFGTMNDNPLKFKKADGSDLDIDLTKENAETGNLIIYMIDYNSDKPKNGDSVQIAATNGEVEDNSDNVQNADNVYVGINVAEVPFHWNIGVYPNPVMKNDDDQVSKKKTNLAGYLQISEDDIAKGAQAIVLDPLGPAPSSGDVTIEISIYDALGHLIVEDEELKVSNDGEVWYFLWNGQNKKGRDVGSGIYLAYIKISPETLGVIAEPLKLGVGQ